MNIQELIQVEGNEKRFTYKGYDCLIRRADPDMMGHLCGYVRIPIEHELYGLSYDEIEEKYNYELPSHGGLTFGGELVEVNEYWIGFDCAHGLDILPASPPFISFLEGAQYRTMEYVEGVLKEMVDFIEEDAK